MRERFAAWERRATPFWEERHWAAILLTIYLPAAWLAYAWFFAPSPGVAGMVFGGFTVVIFFLRELTALQRLLCMLLVWGFVAIEVKSINKDRKAQEQQHSDDLSTQKAQSQAFEKQMQDDFNQTVSHMEKVFGETEIVLKNVTGGDSYPWIVPQVLPQPGTEFKNGESVPISLVVWNQGNYPLTGVTFTVINPQSVGNNQRITDVQLIDGPMVIPAGHFADLKFNLVPSVVLGRVFAYFIVIRTQGGEFFEALSFKKSKNSDPLAWRGSVCKTPPFGKTNPDGTTGSTPLHSQVEWSDGSKD